LKKALITGIEGFTGKFLSAELRRAGYDVYGISPDANGADPKIIACDICDAPSLELVVAELCPDVVCHLAAIAFVAHGDASAIYRTNVIGTRNLLEALVKSAYPVQSVLLASSANIYGTVAGGVLDEGCAPTPANDYAVSKLAMEYVARIYMAKLPLTIVRPFNYTGLGQSPDFLIPKIVSHFASGEPYIELGNLDVERDFSDVRMVVDCYRRLIGKPGEGGVFNVCSGQGHSLRAVLSLAEEISGRKMEVRVNPKFVRANEVKRLVGSRALLEKQIGPIATISLHTTIEWMLAKNS
jgi:GDP-6-deoxy-D-talose 4-dehydrogenase